MWPRSWAAPLKLPRDQDLQFLIISLHPSRTLSPLCPIISAPAAPRSSSAVLGLLLPWLLLAAAVTQFAAVPRSLCYQPILLMIRITNRQKRNDSRKSSFCTQCHKARGHTRRCLQAGWENDLNTLLPQTRSGYLHQTMANFYANKGLFLYDHRPSAAPFGEGATPLAWVEIVAGSCGVHQVPHRVYETHEAETAPPGAGKQLGWPGSFLAVSKELLKCLRTVPLAASPVGHLLKMAGTSQKHPKSNWGLNYLVPQTLAHLKEK